MILDGQLVFSSLANGDAPTAVADNASANVVDQLVNGLSFSGVGGAYIAPWVIARVSTAFAGTTGTVQAVLQDSPDNVTWTDQLLGAATTVANATKGAILLAARIPPSLNRYLRVIYRIATAVMTAGIAHAFLVLDEDVIDLQMRKASTTVTQTGQINEAVTNSVLDS